MKGVALHRFQCTHMVKGPSKDYIALTDYRRESKAPLG
jgi:hypothetical protein